MEIQFASRHFNYANENDLSTLPAPVCGLMVGKKFFHKVPIPSIENFAAALQ